MEKQHDHRQDGAQLDDHIKHTLELLRDPQGHKFIQKDQMAGGGNRKPLRNALHNAEENSL